MHFLHIQFVGPQHGLEVFGVRLLGFNAQNTRKLLFTLALFVLLYVISKLLRTIAKAVTSNRKEHRISFWARQGISLLTFVLGIIGFLSIWFDNPSRLATGAGLVAAGVAFALQKVITSMAGYFVILRGNTFNVGDRITMGGVRGDVVKLNFMQTVIMEMGQPPSVQDAAPSIWVQSRQFTGRIVTVSNSTVFDTPVYNYTRDFPYLWEEMHIPIAYRDNRARAEEILLEAAGKESLDIAKMAAADLKALEDRFFLRPADLKPRVYWRLTDNWVELTVRFLVKDHDIRGVKDRMSREIISELDKAGIGIASGTYEIVGLPPVRVEMQAAPRA